MKMTSTIEVNIRSDEAIKLVAEANQLAMRDTVVEVTGDAVRLSPWLTGNNRRSLVGEVSKMGKVASGGKGGIPEKMVDDSKTEGAVYSTSGYGGFLETGTSRMTARPYIKPALDKNFTVEKFGKKVKEQLE